jgi:pantetheine-phosphate adenylyltransferase
LECTNAAGYNNLIHNEMMVRKEYQYLDWAKYAEGKKDFCFHFECLDKNYYHGVQITEDLLEAVPPNVYVFAGSFSNFHVGHLSILRECEKECDKVILVVGINPTKPDSIRTLDLRYQNLKELLPFHQVVKWDGLLTDFIREQNKKHPTTLVRGLRSVDDFKVEFSTQRAMEHFYPELQVVYKACPKEYEFVSSSLIKQVQSFGETVEHLLPTTKQIYNLV